MERPPTKTERECGIDGRDGTDGGTAWTAETAGSCEGRFFYFSLHLSISSFPSLSAIPAVTAVPPLVPLLPFVPRSLFFLVSGSLLLKPWPAPDAPNIIPAK